MSQLTTLPPIPTDRDAVTAWVRQHLGHLCCDQPEPSPAFVGGQRAADTALATLDIEGYARRRSMVDPPAARGASKLSPYIRHGLLDLPTVWAHVENAPSYDRFRYQGELLWQEHARHWYALFGTATRKPVAYQQPVAEKPWPHPPWWEEMACIDSTLAELHRDGWCVNQTRMWLAGQFSLRGHGNPGEGENHMFRHLLDGSRAANRMGWQWSAGTSRSRAYNFARRQVTKRAPAYCDTCALRDDCPIRGYAKALPRSRVTPPEPARIEAAFGPSDQPPQAPHGATVWLTAESLGDRDPAMAANPDLPAMFVFDEPLLGKLRLSGKRLVFLAETLADLQQRRDVTIHLGRPTDALASVDVAVTFAPVPGFGPRLAGAGSATVLPWPWLRPPTDLLAERMATASAMPSFKDWCQLTKPVLSAERGR